MGDPASYSCTGSAPAMHGTFSAATILPEELFISPWTPRSGLNNFQAPFAIWGRFSSDASPADLDKPRCFRPESSFSSDTARIRWFGGTSHPAFHVWSPSGLLCIPDHPPSHPAQTHHCAVMCRPLDGRVTRSDAWRISRSGGFPHPEIVGFAFRRTRSRGGEFSDGCHALR